MNQRAHMLSGVAAAVVLTPWLRWRAVALGCGAAFADLDLYVYFALRHRCLSPREAIRYFTTLKGSRERAIKLLHHPAVPFAAMAFVRSSPLVGSFGVGVALHQGLDYWGKRNFKRLCRALEERSGGRCELCGMPQLDIRLMEPHFTGGMSDGDRDARNWLFDCRRCNEQRNSAKGTLA
ncbi:MAG: hypothetical protein JWO42_2202 [Chloroflexi bacterium]|jgi:hypothetical protein|nr:hypothetical protein [Chloroflexota bacterium]